MAEAKACEPLDEARARLSALDRRIDALLADGSTLCLPTVPVVAPRLDDIARMSRNEESRHPVVGLLASCTLPFSRGNLASMTIPCGMTGAGMPVGLQLVSNTEAAVLHVGVLLEAELAMMAKPHGAAGQGASARPFLRGR